MAVNWRGLIFGDDGTGFVIPDRSAIRSTAADYWRELKDNLNIVTTPNSFFGDLIDALAEFTAVMAQNSSDAANSVLFSFARGRFLDAVVEPLTIRLAATPSTAELTVYGAPGLSLAVARLVRVTDFSTTFSTLAAVGPLPAINSANNYVFEIAPFDPVAQNGQTFDLVVDGNPFSEVVGALSTPETIRDGLVAQVLAAALNQGAISGGTSPTSNRAAARVADVGGPIFTIAFTFSGGGGFAFLFPAEQVNAEATESGPTQAATVALRRIVTGQVGWEGVFNQAAAVLGTDEESDQALRLRHRAELRGVGSCNPDAIRSQLLRPVSRGGAACTYASVEYNKNNFVDAAGNLPHSIRAVVNLDADRALVAEVLWRISAGDNYNGPEVENVTDSEGKVQSVQFQYLEDVFVHALIEVLPGESFPTVGDPLAQIQADVVAFIENLPATIDVNPIDLPIELSVATGDRRGVARYRVRLGTSANLIDPPVFVSDYYPDPENNAVNATVVIGSRQRARSDASIVTVTPL